MQRGGVHQKIGSVKVAKEFLYNVMVGRSWCVESLTTGRFTVKSVLPEAPDGQIGVLRAF